MIQNLPKYLGNNLVYEIPVPVAFGCGSDTLTHWSLCRWLLDEAVCVLLPAFTCEPLRHTDPFESLQVAAGRGCVCPPAGLHLWTSPAHWPIWVFAGGCWTRLCVSSCRPSPASLSGTWWSFSPLGRSHSPPKHSSTSSKGCSTYLRNILQYAKQTQL